MVCALVWGIGLRRLGCGCGRRLVTGSYVIRETTETGCPWSRPRVSMRSLTQLPRRRETNFGALGHQLLASARYELSFSAALG